MRIGRMVSAALIWTVLAGNAGAQNCAMMGSGATPMAGRAGMMAGCQYDTTTVSTMSGSVVGVDTIGRMGMRLRVRFARETLPVEVGPMWAVSQASMSFAAGDKIDVTGSRVRVNGTATIIAREIRKSGKTIKLRDRTGMPTWGGMMGRAGPPKP